MSYATSDQMRAYLSQVPAGATVDALLQDCLDRATDAIDKELGFTFSTFGTTATTKDVQTSVGDNYLRLPAFKANSATTVLYVYAKGSTSESTQTCTDWTELPDGRLYRYDGFGAGWYRVTAIWGYGVAPAGIVQICLEVAINLWIGSQGGQFSDVVGVEGGGAVGYNRAWTNRQRNILESTKRAYNEWGIA